MSESGPPKRLCEWVCNARYEDVPEDVRREALRVIYDQVGGMIAGATLESCQPVVEVVRALGGPGECTVVGHPFRAPLLNAVMANGSIGHSDEVDATSVHGAGHFAATVVPTVLSMGQYVQASGKACAHAFVLGAEVAARMQSALNAHSDARPEFYYSAGAALGAAVTTGLLLGLDADKMEHALGTAAMGCAPLMSLHHEELHQTKGLAYSGRTARAGVESALLARHGFHAPREILTTENGFFDAFVGYREVGHEAARDLGDKYLMKDLLYKRYSAGGPNLAPLYAFFQLKKQHGFTGGDIAAIEISGVSSKAIGQTDHHPSIHTETVMSLAACYGEFTFSHAHDLSYSSDPRFLDYKKNLRITITPRKGASSMAHRLQGEMTLRMRDGRTLTQTMSYPQLTQEELDNKFVELAGLRLDKNRVQVLADQLKNIEQLDSIVPLVDGLGIAY